MAFNTSEGQAGARMSPRQHGTEEVRQQSVNYRDPLQMDAAAQMRDWLWDRYCDAYEHGARELVIKIPENPQRGARVTIYGLGIVPERIRSI